MELKKLAAKQGFTLIETVVTVGLFAVLAVVVTQTFLQLTRTNDFLKTQLKLKQEGDAVMTSMQRELRNAQEITACTTNSITYKDRSSPTNTLTFGLDAATSTKIVSVSGTTEQPLNSSDATVSNFSISCETSSGAVYTSTSTETIKLARIGFTLKRTSPTAGIATFSGLVGLRNY